MQNLVAAQKDRVWSLIEKGAIIYVCGDGGKMEPDVKAALVAIYRERKGADADAGLRWIDDLGTNNRYVLDVWAGGSWIFVNGRPGERRDPYDSRSISRRTWHNFVGSRSNRQPFRDLMEGLLVDGEDRHLRVPNRPGSSSVPTFRSPRRPGRRVTICVPHSAQNSRVTALQIAARKLLGVPLV